MRFYFIGVTTAQSSIVKIFPKWAKALGLELELIGIDLPINAQPPQYIKAILDFKNDPLAIGAVITSHKLNFFKHASYLFDDLDEPANLTKEISVITKHDNHLTGAVRPELISTTLSLKKMLGPNHWQKHSSDVLCFGAGGVARSIVLSLLFDFESEAQIHARRNSSPRKIILVDHDPQQLQSISDLLDPLKGSIELHYTHQNNAHANDLLLANLPIGSLVINAAGMGKDLPGSPLTDQASFPPQSIIWDLNYRGERLFLQQARTQETNRSLNIHDGWLCFLHGWTQAISMSAGKSLSHEQFLQLTKIAETFRPSIY